MLSMHEIYEQHYQYVYGYIRSVCHNHELAEELAQETFYLATKSYHNFRGDAKIEVWLCQIAKRQLFKTLRNMKDFQTISMEAEIGEIQSDIDIEAEYIQKELMEKIYRCIDTFDDESKQLMLTKLRTNMSFKEIGRIYGKTEEWARTTFYRRKSQIKAMMRKEDDKDEARTKL